MAKAKADRLYLNKKLQESDLQFKVVLKSHWQGEKNVKHTNQGTLKATIEQAVKKFLELNKRSNVDAGCSVYLVLPNGSEIELPEFYWEEYHNLIP